MRNVLGGLIAAVVSLGFVDAARASETVQALYLKIAQEQAATLSNMDPVPDDLGQAGAALAAMDNNTTGQFMGYQFDVTFAQVDEGDIEGARAVLAQSAAQYVLLDMSAAQISAMMQEASTSERLYFNVAAQETALRDDRCHASLLHTIPSYAMRADALMQFFVQKRWRKLAMIVGERAADGAYAQAIEAAATKYGVSVVDRRDWAFDEDVRRAASREVPLFTQDLAAHDVLIVADEANDFARYIAYNTWEPRPIAGGDGLMSTAWSRVVEQWGAAQLQSRFHELAGREMQAEDYAAWAALRSIDEAFVRTDRGDFDAVRAYLMGDDFALAGFKGRPLSYRPWNGQLRQPIPLVTGTAVVAMAPLEGFLHARNELDALGLDAGQSACAEFGG